MTLEESTSENTDLLLHSYADCLIPEVKYLRGNNWDFFFECKLMFFNLYYYQHRKNNTEIPDSVQTTQYFRALKMCCPEGI